MLCISFWSSFEIRTNSTLLSVLRQYLFIIGKQIDTPKKTSWLKDATNSPKLFLIEQSKFKHLTEQLKVA
ncbi:MAG: hypothetical protein ACM3H8_12140 [Sphingobacteriales bacterium]